MVRKYSMSLMLAIAAAAHGVNAAYCRSIGDDTQKSWDDAPDWQRDSALAGVEFHIKNPDASDSASHENWMAQKIADGWVFGEKKDARKKTHPCLVPFEQLPAEQQAKDALFRSVVRGIVDRYDDDVARDNDTSGAPNIALAEAQKNLNDIGQSMVPLGKYLQAEGLMTVEDGSQVTVAQIADAALQALQEAKAGTVEMQGMIKALTPDPSQVKTKRTKPISVASKVEDEEFETATSVLFGDDQGNLIADLATLSFSSDKFAGSTAGRTLNADIEFPVHGPASTVAAAFLVAANGKAVSKSEMVSPLSVSGGRSARINSGSLLFRAPEKPVTDAKAA